MSNGYLVISADCHAGPDSPVYREFLDPQYRDEFDDELARARRAHAADAPRALRHRRRRLRRRARSSRRSGSARTRTATASTRSACAAAGTPRRATRSSTADGVTGEVVFPGPDAVTGKMGAPFGAGFDHRRHRRPRARCSPARVRTTAGRPSCARPEPAATRRADRRADPRRHRRRHRRDPPAHGEGLRGGIIIPAQWGEHASYTNYRYDPVWAVCEDARPAGAHPLGSRPRTPTTATVPGVLGLYATRRSGGPSRPLWFLLLVGRVRALPRAEDGGHRGRRVLGCRPAVAHPTR